MMSVAYLADLASLIGLLVTLVGFAVTIRGVGQARRAAEAARLAARETLVRVRERLMGEEIGLSLTYLIEIQSSCRDRRWDVAILRSGDLIARLAHLLPHPTLVAEELDEITIAIRDIRPLLNELERLRRSTSPKDLPTKYFEVLIRINSTLNQIRGRIQTRAFEV